MEENIDFISYKDFDKKPTYRVSKVQQRQLIGDVSRIRNKVLVTLMKNNIDFEDGMMDVGLSSHVGEFFTIGTKNIYQEVVTFDVLNVYKSQIFL
jgi:hypothetical protein